MGQVLFAPELFNPILRGVGNWRTFAAVVDASGHGDYTQVDQAIDAGATVIFVKPGTYSKFTADVANLFIMGSGRGTLISGGVAGHAVAVSAADVTLMNLAAQTTAGGGQNYDAFNVSARTNLIGCVAVNSDRYGFSFEGTGDDSLMVGCRVIASDDDGVLIDLDCENCIIAGNRIAGWNNEAIDDNSGTSVTANLNDETV